MSRRTGEGNEIMLKITKNHHARQIVSRLRLMPGGKSPISRCEVRLRTVFCLDFGTFYLFFL